MAEMFDCRNCGVPHVRRRDGSVIFYALEADPFTTIKDLNGLIGEYSRTHPGLNVYFDGDTRSVCGCRKKTSEQRLESFA